jgi:hypothetical protein
MKMKRLRMTPDEISGIVKQVYEKDKDLAILIEDLFKCIQNNFERLFDRHDMFSELETADYTVRDIKTKEIFDCFDGRDWVLTYPSEKSEICPCKPYFVGVAFGPWQSKNGFSGAAKRAMEYWLACFNENRGTVILTDAWDSSNFRTQYEDAFNFYTNGCSKENKKRHTVCAIFFGRERISIEYLE